MSQENGTAREFTLPDDLVFGSFLCAGWSPHTSASCLTRERRIPGASLPTRRPSPPRRNLTANSWSRARLDGFPAGGYGPVVETVDRVSRIPGWLRPEDAEKLWELAQSTSGPILEIGTHHGKSAVLMALARKEAGQGGPLYTLDVDSRVIAAAAAQARTHRVSELIVFVRGTSAAFRRVYPWLRPALTFVDGDHTRAGVDRDLAALEMLVPVGGRLLFHDFHDPLNEDATCAAIKVRPAVEASWVKRDCSFDGVFGCCGLYTRRHATARDEGVVDLLRLDSAKDQYLHRLRYPAGRLWRRFRGAGPT